MTNETHDPARRSWVESASTPDTDFPIQNLPLGVFRRRGTSDAPAIGVAIGDQILDLRRARERGLLEGLPAAILDAASTTTLNDLMGLGKDELSRFRRQLVAILDASGRYAEPQCLVPMADAAMLLPAVIGDFTDFYASIYHATRVGEMFRPGGNPLPPNYKHVPIAYHGRASSIVPSGTPVRRPSGQSKGSGGAPAFRPSDKLDYEVEIGVFVGPGNALGSPVGLADADRHVFGLCIVNDWSARDIQAWESQPLGPFLSKNFATSLSPWVVTYEALEPFRCAAFRRPAEDPRPLPYLSSRTNDASGGFDVTVEVLLRTETMREAGTAPIVVGHSSLRDMYWTIPQMLAHHTSSGCNLRPGDLVASGTISGPARGSEGCLLEMTRNGTQPIQLANGESRAFLADGDEVIMRAYCERSGYARIGFGTCEGQVRPAIA